MALEQSIVMGIALAYLFVRMLVESEREAQRGRALSRSRPDGRRLRQRAAPHRESPAAWPASHDAG